MGHLLLSSLEQLGHPTSRAREGQRVNLAAERTLFTMRRGEALGPVLVDCARHRWGPRGGESGLWVTGPVAHDARQGSVSERRYEPAAGGSSEPSRGGLVAQFRPARLGLRAPRELPVLASAGIRLKRASHVGPSSWERESIGSQSRAPTGADVRLVGWSLDGLSRGVSLAARLAPESARCKPSRPAGGRNGGPLAAGTPRPCRR